MNRFTLSKTVRKENNEGCVMSFSDIVRGSDGEFGVYISRPKDGVEANGAALVILQEIFGVNGVMRDVADKYAELGYVAIVPDLFWRIEPGISITDKTPEEWKRAFELFGAFNVDTGIVDIAATIEYTRTTLAISKVGAVGYCLGGLLAYLTSCRTSIDASVSYYGVTINERLDEIDKVTKPLMLHVASLDKFVPAEAREQIIAAAKNNSNITIHVYDGLDHAFARPGGDHYDATGATLANERTADFFKTSLF
jgi:carboxymethylenebutenolidase